MAMRPRGGRAGPNREPRVIVGRVYETFKPMSEWRQGDDYDTLLVYLPGFQKEYIKVTTEDLNIVRVRGERLIAANKWSRFQEDFRVPENCEMRGIRARFEGGILTITMPRKIITAPPPPTTAAPPPTITAPPPPPSATTQVPPKSEETPLRRRKQQEEALVQKPNKDHQDSKQKASSSNESEKKPEKPQTTTQVAPKSEEPPLARRKQEETLVQKPPKDHQDSKQKATSSNESEKKPEKPLEGSSSTLPPPSQPMPTKQEASKTKAGGDQFVPKNSDKGKSKEAVVEEEKNMGSESRKGESKGGKVAENAVVKGGNGWRSGLNEDRKMVVNVGVALLVIVALGFHVSYTIGLIGKGK